MRYNVIKAEVHEMKKVLYIFFIIFSSVAIFAFSSNAQAMSIEEQANENIKAMLKTFPRNQYDEVEKVRWYKQDGYYMQSATRVYWYVGIDAQNNIIQRAHIIHYSQESNWVFWDKLIFSTNEGNWEYNIGSFAGQSGNGKFIQSISGGGKFETLDVTFDKLKPCFENLVKGTNPIIRLKGRDYYHDIRLNEQQMQNIKNALIFAENVEIVGGKLSKTEEKK